MFISVRSFLAVLASTLLVITTAQAQEIEDFSKVELKTTKIADDFYTIEGGAIRMSVFTGPDGVLLVDSHFGELNDRVLAEIRKISNKPIRFLINTQVHHVGGNEAFAKMGVTLLSRDQVRTRLIRPNPSPGGVPVPPAPAQALPVVTYDGPVTIHLNGEDIRLLSMRNAHTDGDTVVYFPAHDILAGGDYFRAVGYPFIDVPNGGSLKGTLAALDATISMAGPNTRIIPGHGPISDRNGVIAHRDMLLAVRDKIAPLVAQGKTVEEVIATRPAASFNTGLTETPQSTERFVRRIYGEVKAGG